MAPGDVVVSSGAAAVAMSLGSHTLVNDDCGCYCESYNGGDCSCHISNCEVGGCNYYQIRLFWTPTFDTRPFQHDCGQIIVIISPEDTIQEWSGC